MTIHRGKLPNDHFTMIPNRWTRDASLSWAARGLLVWLMGHAVGYKISENLIVASGPSSRDAVRTMIQALEAAGYLKRVRTSLPTGGSTVDYLLQDPGDGYIDSLEVDFSDSRSDQDKQQVSAVEPDDGKAAPRSCREDQEKTKTPSVSSRASRSDRGTRLPEDFMPDEKMRAWFVGEQLGACIDGAREHQKFMNYWLAKPGAAGRKTDWRRTWMNWMLQAAERGPRPGSALAPTSGAPMQYSQTSKTNQRVAEGLALAEKFAQMEESQ